MTYFDGRISITGWIMFAAIKNKLRENTEFAINKGAFGVPTFYIDDEMYWGIDSMKFLVEYLKNQ